MKKEYFAPEIIFDSFSLSQTIAGVNDNCDRNLTNMYSGSCGMEMGESGRVLFTFAAAGCDFKAQDGEYGICYHVPMAGNRLFNS